MQALQKIKAWLLWLMCISVFGTTVIGFAVGKNQGISVMLGALTVIVAQAIFGYYCFRYSGALQVRKIWQSFVKGEVLKIFFSFVLFALIFRYGSVMPIWYFLSFILMQFIQWVINCWLLNR